MQDQEHEALTAALQQIRQLIRFTGVLTKLVGASSRATVELLQADQSLPENRRQELLDMIQEQNQELEKASRELSESSSD